MTDDVIQLDLEERLKELAQMPYRVEYPTEQPEVFEIEIVYSAIEALECADIGGGKVYEISQEEATENLRQLEGR
jgi:hypothetical protein